jgi:hypothetical protein
MTKPELVLVIVAACSLGVVILVGLYRFVTVNSDLRNDDIGFSGPSWLDTVCSIPFW